MENIVISQINSSSPKYQQVWELREEILRRPLGLSLRNEDLSRDHIDTIFIAEHDGMVIACLLLQRKDAKQLQLRQMAVASGWQGKNIGRLLVNAAEDFSLSNGYTSMMMHARKVATGFYLSLGYSIKGDEFTEVGIPHFLMEKELEVRT
jgi:predicted GNAT family N-acyltransferase